MREAAVGRRSCRRIRITSRAPQKEALGINDTGIDVQKREAQIRHPCRILAKEVITACWRCSMPGMIALFAAP
jgi:hypothetical protein